MRGAAGRTSVVERYGLEAVPAHQKNTPWYRFAFIQMAVAANAGNFLVPALAVIEGGLSFWSAVLCTCAGAWLGFLFVSYLSLPGARLGIPAQYAIRTMLGVRGAQFLSSPVRSLTSLYWFGVQTIGGTYVIQELVSRISGAEFPFWVVSFPLSLLMVILAIIGFDAVKKATSYFLPLLLAGEGTMLYVYFTTNNESGASLTLAMDGWSGSFPMMLFFSSLAFVQYVSGVSASADMTRYAKTPAHGFWGLLTGNGAGFLLTAVIGCASASLYSSVNPYVSSSNQTMSPLIIGVITLTAVISMISINVSNAYTGGFSLLNIFPKLSRVQSAVLFGAAGVVLSGFPSLVNEAESFISLLGGLIIPISAVLASDYLWVKRGRMTHEDLNFSAHAAPFNTSAIGAISLGTLLYFFIPGDWSPGFLTFMVIALFYPLIHRKSNVQP
ncbi:purine-cytosine permease family protein [Halobacillus litoralis]|uniref:purine-cytosine permease family protein n=1 Tax=Halobacillus litoralis TaxID=45668 RepID=UPI001CD7A467|nr:cytosine permease [Halobacillus litoralis]MCA1021901.1 cytosine permease [Halobacillus litoralis]